MARCVPLIAFSLLGGAGCNAVSGVGSLSFADDAGAIDGGGVGGGGAGVGGGGVGGGGGAPEPCPGRCTEPAPQGWTRVGMAADPSDACPAGTFASDRKENPSAARSACPCTSCVVDRLPGCSAGKIPTWHGDVTCGTAGVVLDNPNDGACDDFSGAPSVQTWFKADPPSPVGGSCSAMATPDMTSVSATTVRLCESDCESALCGGIQGMSECVAADGDEPCPAGDFTERHVVGTSAKVSCASCGCTFTATCAGVLAFFANANCAQPLISMPADGSCSQTGMPPTPVKSYSYMGTATAMCEPEGTAIATVALDGVQTVCCRPPAG